MYVVWIITKEKEEILLKEQFSGLVWNKTDISSGVLLVPFLFQKTYKVCEWHRTGRSWNHFGKQDQTRKWFRNLERWHETKKVESENKPRGVMLRKKKSNTKSEHVAKQQTTQSSWVTAGQNIKMESTIWLITAWKSNLLLEGIHHYFLYGV